MSITHSKKRNLVRLDYKSSKFSNCVTSAVELKMSPNSKKDWNNL